MSNSFKILIAPDSFKGSLSASKIASIIANELSKSDLPLEITKIPLADGGEGSIESIMNTCTFSQIKFQVFNPCFDQVDAIYLYDNEHDTAYIELAQASGIQWISPDYQIMKGSTFGTGELIKHAIQNGAKQVVLFIGGSATNDAGLGILEALGFRFFDSNGQKIAPLPCNMGNVSAIDDIYSVLTNRNTEITIAVDVDNPFYGESGAACVYAPQKGASPEQVVLLDQGLRQIARLIYDTYSIDIQQIKGSGAAGGVGGGLYAFAGAKIVSGSRLIFDLLDIESKIKKADIIISGEGKIDAQTLNNKLLYNISNLTKKYNKKLWAVCGFFEGDERIKKELNIDKIFSLAVDKQDINEAILNTETRLKKCMLQIISELEAF
ncbi:MAG: glycerate kinase [Bacteroidales bacterium]|nr:glycerate kinase [Bacteroidales bacterium]